MDPDISPDASARLVKKLKKVATYLNNESYVIQLDNPQGERKNIKIYGTPYSSKPPVNNKYVAFQKTVEESKKVCESIPDDTDILLTHGPGVYQSGALLVGFKSVGSALLSKRIEEVQPMYHIFDR
eukprot:UN07500